MKKLALLLCGFGSLAILSVSAANYTSPQPEPQYQEQCAPAPCVPDSACYQLPCNAPVAVPCNTDTVCTPVPCNTPAPCTTPAPAPAVVPGCC